jgi:hypothetical protein
MLRAFLVFRAQGADVVPSTSPIGSAPLTNKLSYMPSNRALRLSDGALYDYASTAYYWARGWFRPAPELTR